MSGLEQSFYIIAIIFMAVSLLLIIKILRALAIISHELSNLEKSIDKKFPSEPGAPNVMSDIVSAIKDFAKSVK